MDHDNDVHLNGDSRATFATAICCRKCTSLASDLSVQRGGDVHVVACSRCTPFTLHSVGSVVVIAQLLSQISFGATKKLIKTMAETVPAQRPSWIDEKLGGMELGVVLTQDYLEPTETFENNDTVESTPFTDSSDLFWTVHDLTEEAIGPTSDLFKAWKQTLKVAFGESGDMDGEMKARVVNVSVRLAKTSPAIFGDNFVLVEGEGEFRFMPFVPKEGARAITTDEAQERNDIVLWMASLKLLGKCFDGGWARVSVEDLVANLNPNENVLKVTIGDEEFFVTRAAEDAMSTSLDAMAGQPTIFSVQTCCQGCYTNP